MKKEEKFEMKMDVKTHVESKNDIPKRMEDTHALSRTWTMKVKSEKEFENFFIGGYNEENI